MGHHNGRQATRTRRWRSAFAAVLLLTSTASSASAQNYSFDARRIALGGAGGTPNIATKLVERQRRYRSILIPVGLVKAISDYRVFFPNRDDFDFSRAVEIGTRPLHHTFGGDDIRGFGLFRDIVDARVNPDLNAYRSSGFEVSQSTFEEGLLALTWGKTFMLRQDERSFHGIYVGAGPYFGIQAGADFDSELVGILNSSTNRYVPAATFGLGGTERHQLAIAITGGYHARFPMFAQDGEGASRNGMYVAANYHHLWGLRMDDIDARLQLETDSFGLVSPQPQAPPFALGWQESDDGRGLAMDFGVAFVRNRWDFGVGVGGVANRMTWSEIERHLVGLVSLHDGNEWVHVRLPVTDLKRRFELPVTFTSDVAYHREAWSVLTEYSHGYQGHNFRSGLEYRLGKVELRGGGRYNQGDVHPSFGAGFNLRRNFGIDAAVFGTKTFLESKPKLGLAISLRWDKRDDPPE
jgi:hypothetical protein